MKYRLVEVAFSLSNTWLILDRLQPSPLFNEGAFVAMSIV